MEWQKRGRQKTAVSWGRACATSGGALHLIMRIGRGSMDAARALTKHNARNITILFGHSNNTVYSYGYFFYFVPAHFFE